MPVNDDPLTALSDDDLRDRVDEWADEWADSGDIGYALTGRDLIYEVAKRWRAALAARPQPLIDLAAALAEYDQLHDAFMNDPAEDVETAVRLTAPLPKAKDAVIAAAREAVAGSATPTHPWAREVTSQANDWAVAGSATPTRTDDE